MQTEQTTTYPLRVHFITLRDGTKDRIAESEKEINEFLATHNVQSVQVLPGYSFGNGMGKFPKIMIVYREGDEKV